MLAKDQPVTGKPHGLRCHNFIGHRIFQNTILMNPGLMGKGICPHNSLVRLHYNSGDHGGKSAGGMYLICADGGGQVHHILAGIEGHHHLFKGGVACPLTDTVYSNLCLACSGPDPR